MIKRGTSKRLVEQLLIGIIIFIHLCYDFAKNNGKVLLPITSTAMSLVSCQSRLQLGYGQRIK